MSLGFLPSAPVLQVGRRDVEHGAADRPASSGGADASLVGGALGLAWRRFSPPEVDPQLCLARVWAGGSGAQCTRRRVAEDVTGCCRVHARGGQWRVHGLVDGPIPDAKLREFERAWKRMTEGKAPRGHGSSARGANPHEAFEVQAAKPKMTAPDERFVGTVGKALRPLCRVGGRRPSMRATMRWKCSPVRRLSAQGRESDAALPTPPNCARKAVLSGWSVAPQTRRLSTLAVPVFGLGGNRLLLGGWRAGADVAFAKRFRIRHVICCCTDMADQPWPETSRLCKRHLFSLPSVGSGSEDPPEDQYVAWKHAVEGAIAVIEKNASKKGRRVLVHDISGQNRAVAVCVAWAVVHLGMPLATALGRVRRSITRLGLEALTAPGVSRFLVRFAEDHGASQRLEEKAPLARKRKLEDIASGLEKRTRTDPALSAVRDVGRILADSERFPAEICDDTREILLGNLSLAMEHQHEEHRKIQIAAIAQVGEVLHGVRQRLAAAADVAEARVVTAQELMKRQLCALDERTSAVEAAQEEVLVGCVEVESAEAAALEALREVTGAVASQRRGRARSRVLSAERMSYARGLAKGRQQVGDMCCRPSPPPQHPGGAGGQPAALFEGKLAKLDAQISATDEDVAGAARRAAAAQARTQGMRAIAVAARQRVCEARSTLAERKHQRWVARRSMSFAGDALATRLIDQKKADAAVDTVSKAVAGIREVSLMIAAGTRAEDMA